MYLLTDAETDDHIQALDDAWARDDTFAYAPRKSGAGKEWIETALAELPADLRTGHFALLTSGSTGQPKLVIGQKARSEALARALHERQESEAVRRTVVALPLTYCYAFVNQWLWARVMDRELILTPGFSSPDQLERTLVAAEDAMFCMVGAQVPLLTGGLAGRVFPGVRRLHFAGGRFPQDKLDVLRPFFPNAQVYNNYGCAEAMPRLAIRRAEAAAAGANIGHPLPGVELMAGEQDALLFRSPYGIVGYVDATGFHAIISEDWVPTGDLARQQADGTWELLGRANEVFKRYGEKVSLPSLLTTLAPAWSGQMAFYRETDAAGELGHVLVLEGTPDEDAVRAVLRALRANYSRVHWPLRIESVMVLPRLPNGKINTLSLNQDPGWEVHWRQRI